MPSLRIKVLAGRQLPDALVRQMSDLRRSVMTMKPSVNLARDFEKFSAICRSSDSAILFFDQAEELAGMYLLFFRTGRAQNGQRYLLVLSEFAFMRPAYRANPALPRSLFHWIARVLWQWRGESIWFGGLGYPTGMLAGQKFFGEMVLRGEAGLTAMQSELLNLITAEFAGSSWEQEKGYASMPTIPPQVSVQWQLEAEQDAFYQRYLQLCPNWQQGYGLPGVTRVRPLLLMGHTVRKLVRRMLRPERISVTSQ